ncbi:PAP2 superfamily [Legionella lansingensis]|uniref:PAP2 superfamily protein n=1 Tax=Legionella lansingensis TaxID=45067 RepID=A0A0W0V787_9GAMM|nr:phosphatase PAP2 family protein [Legionella lansingensis]KTD15973.1 PAP2 superfamily protein [Legionella lansingensis]SNV56583.1 PAP2 superfamily [Legionella lansingensis]
MLDNIATFFLLFSKPFIVVPLLTIGLLWIDREFFYQAATLVLISIIINVALKVTFKIPLSPSIGKDWYAFPSGHMQTTTVLYGWFAYKIPISVLRGLIVILLIGVGFGLIHFGYHNIYDVLGALFFAALIIGLYQYLYSRLPKALPYILASLAIILMIYIQLTYHKIPTHAWGAFYSLLGLILADKLFNRGNMPLSFYQKLAGSILCFIIFLLVYFLFQIKTLSNLPPYLYQSQWIILAFSIAKLSLGKKWK